MTAGTRKFAGPDGLIISAMLDHDDEQCPALSIIAWPKDGPKIEVTYSFGDAAQVDGFPVEFWLETMLRLLTPELASEIIAAAKHGLERAAR